MENSQINFMEFIFSDVDKKPEDSSTKIVDS